jgi:hypothetical protein
VGREALLFFVAGSDGRTRAGPRKLGWRVIGFENVGERGSTIE